MLFYPDIISVTTLGNESKKTGIYPLDCTILDSWVFENFTLADKPFSKDLGMFETCVLVNNNLWQKLILSLELPTTFD